MPGVPDGQDRLEGQFLVEATPKAFRVRGRFKPVGGEGPAWSHPVIHDGKLYLRCGDVVAC